MSLATIFKDLEPKVQISMVGAMTIISIVALIMGHTQIALIAIIAFAPTPFISMLNMYFVVRHLTSNFDTIAVATKATDVKAD